jgi:hypothetical protein
VVCVTGPDDAWVGLGAAINRIVPRYNINIQYIYIHTHLEEGCFKFYL